MDIEPTWKACMPIIMRGLRSGNPVLRQRAEEVFSVAVDALDIVRAEEKRADAEGVCAVPKAVLDLLGVC